MDLSNKTTYQLKTIAKRENIPLPRTGSGRKGRVLKQDIIDAILAASEKTDPSEDLSKLSKNQLRELAQRENISLHHVSDRKLEIIEAILAGRVRQAVQRKPKHQQPQQIEHERLALRFPLKKRSQKKKKRSQKKKQLRLSLPLKKRPSPPPLLSRKKHLPLKKRSPPPLLSTSKQPIQKEEPIAEVGTMFLPGIIDFTTKLSSQTYLFRNLIEKRLERIKILDMDQHNTIGHRIDIWKRLSRESNCHPAILCIYDDGIIHVQGESKYAIRFEHHPKSIDLGTLLKRRKHVGGEMDFTPMVSLVYLAVKGLKYIHDMGVVHGSIVPSNIVLSPNRVQYQNIGVSKRVRPPSSKQQLMADDIYALGVVFYLLNGQRPYTANKRRLIPFVYKQMPELEEYVTGMVAPDPKERFRAFGTLLIYLNLRAKTSIKLQQRPKQDGAPGSSSKVAVRKRKKPVITIDNWDSKPCTGKGSWKLREMQDYASWHGLSKSGTKQQLCQRIREHIAGKVPFESVFTSERVPHEILMESLFLVRPEDLIKMCEMTPRLHRICQDQWFREQYRRKWKGYHPPLKRILVRKTQSRTHWSDLLNLKKEMKCLFRPDETYEFELYLQNIETKKKLGLKTTTKVDAGGSYIVYHVIVESGKGELKELIPGHYIVIEYLTYVGFIAIAIRVHPDTNLEEFTKLRSEIPKISVWGQIDKEEEQIKTNVLTLLKHAIQEKRIGFVFVNLRYYSSRYQRNK